MSRGQAPARRPAPGRTSGQSRARQEIADAVDKSYRTIGNWTSRHKPTMPTAKERAIIRKIVGPYDQQGDAVEVAVRASRLTPDRQHAVLHVYTRELRLQDAEEQEGRRGA